jgi:hypothetical protein
MFVEHDLAGQRAVSQHHHHIEIARLGGAVDLDRRGEAQRRGRAVRAERPARLLRAGCAGPQGNREQAP